MHSIKPLISDSTRLFFRKTSKSFRKLTRNQNIDLSEGQEFSKEGRSRLYREASLNSFFIESKILRLGDKFLGKVKMLQKKRKNNKT